MLRILLNLTLSLLMAAAISFAQSDTLKPADTLKAETQIEAQPQKQIEAKPQKTEEMTKPVLTVEAVVCAGIEERMPVGTADNFTAEVGQVYLWCKVLGAKDTTAVYHVWYYNDEEMARVELPVRSNAWRTWSSKQILPSWTGNWTAKIENADGKVLKEIPFKIGGVE